MRKPRPIIVASAIEKSDFRTHLDEMSSSLRAKIGGLIKRRKDSRDKSRTRPDLTSASSDYGSRSTDFTPSIGAVPSLTASTTPSEGQETYSTGHHSHSTSASTLRRGTPLADPAVRELVKMYNAHPGMVQPPSSSNSRLSEFFDPIQCRRFS